MDSLPRCISRQVFLTGYVPDDQPPVTGFTPVDGSEDVPQHAQVIITFDEPVTRADGSTLKSSDLDDILSFTETQGSSVVYTAMINAWKTKITLTPDTLKPQTEYHVEINANALADREGNLISDPQMTTFITEGDQGIDQVMTDRVSIYPNPTNSQFYIGLADLHAIAIHVYDNTGKKIIDIEDIKDEIIPVDMEQHEPGIYIVEVVLESGSFIAKKLLKE
jgi:hypothetical protein